MDKELELSINRNCNRKCIYCDFMPFMPQEKESKLSNIFKNIKKASKQKIENLAIVGGEPTIHKNLPEIIYIAKKNKFKDISLVTNGIRLADRKYLHKLSKLGLTSVSLNLPHYKERKFEIMTGKKKSFKKVIQAIKNLNEEKIFITAFIVISKMNYKDLKEISNFYLKLKIKNFVFAYIRYMGRAEKNSNKLKIGMKTCLPYLKKAVDHLLKNKVTISFENFLPCILKGYEKYMSDFYEKKEVDLGKIYHQGASYDDLYKISYRDNIKTKKCNSCIYYQNCVGLTPGYFKIFKDREIKAIKNV